LKGRLAAPLQVRPRSVFSFNPQSAIRNPQSKGFTLLELMIVISVIIILAVIVMPQYLRTVQHAREATLQDSLFQMRKMIDQYAADKGRLPQSLDDLVASGYLREVPIDPMTEARDWNVETGQDPLSADGGSGVTDVRSSSSEIGSNGVPYNQW
jgi:general secretion pathway protein G